MSAFERSASLANSSRALGWLFFFRLAIRDSSISDATVHHPLSAENHSRVQRRQVGPGLEVPEARLCRKTDRGIPGAIPVVFVPLHHFEEESLGERARIHMMVGTPLVFVVQDIELCQPRESRIIEAESRAKIVVVVLGDRQ